MTKRVLSALLAVIVIAPIGFFFGGVGASIYEGAALSTSVGIVHGMKRSFVEARMASSGFVCSAYGEKKYLAPVPLSQEEVLCRKEERLGSGLTQQSRFLIAMFPLELIYNILPKDEATDTYKESTVAFVFDNDIISTMQPSVRLRPWQTTKSSIIPYKQLKNSAPLAKPVRSLGWSVSKSRANIS